MRAPVEEQCTAWPSDISGRPNPRNSGSRRVPRLLFISSGILYIGKSVAAEPPFELLAEQTWFLELNRVPDEGSPECQVA